MASRLEIEISAEVRACRTRAAAGDAPSVRYGVGSVLGGKYRLDALLGEGAMGAVWQATNLLLDSRVAIKLTHAELTGEAFRERLQLEARAAAGLGHPAIVRVFDVGETDLGDPFIVMELLQGGTLSQMLSQGRLPAVRAVQIVLPIVDALSAMHARGVVHRDLKPDNLLISLDDQRVQPKILDFGIAKLSDPRYGRFEIDESGTLVGSPEYMSPEQTAASADIDHTTDIWSICIVLYEAISGETPFAAPNTVALLRAIAEQEPTSLVQRGVADEQLWEIIRVGLSKNRDGRHHSMQALGRALARWLLDRGVHEDVCGTALGAKWFANDEAATAGGLRRSAHGAVMRRAHAQTAPRLGRRVGSSGRGAWGLHGKRAARTVKVCTLAAGLALACFAIVPKLGAGASAGMRGAQAAFRPTPITIAKEPVPPHLRDEERAPDLTSTTVPALSLADTPPAQSVRSVKRTGNQTSMNGVRQALPAPSGRRALHVAVVAEELDLIAPY
jgi:tRNA A-37 threonylcarbamoyl transferase component Bud32